MPITYWVLNLKTIWYRKILITLLLNSKINFLKCFFFYLQKLLQPFKYILQVPGKQIRGKLANAFNYWLKIPSDKLTVVVEIVQILHNSSLLYVSVTSF